MSINILFLALLFLNCNTEKNFLHPQCPNDSTINKPIYEITHENYA